MYVNLQIMEAIKIYTIDDGEYISISTRIQWLNSACFTWGLTLNHIDHLLGVSINVYNTAN